MSDFVIVRISGIKCEIVNAAPGQICSCFNRTIHFPHFCFYNLRHCYASIFHAMSIPHQWLENHWCGCPDDLSIYLLFLSIALFSSVTLLNLFSVFCLFLYFSWSHAGCSTGISAEAARRTAHCTEPAETESAGTQKVRSEQESALLQYSKHLST